MEDSIIVSYNSLSSGHRVYVGVSLVNLISAGATVKLISMEYMIFTSETTVILFVDLLLAMKQSSFFLNDVCQLAKAVCNA